MKNKALTFNEQALEKKSNKESNFKGGSPPIADYSLDLFEDEGQSII